MLLWQTLIVPNCPDPMFSNFHAELPNETLIKCRVLSWILQRLHGKENPCMHAMIFWTYWDVSNQAAIWAMPPIISLVCHQFMSWCPMALEAQGWSSNGCQLQICLSPFFTFKTQYGLTWKNKQLIKLINFIQELVVVGREVLHLGGRLLKWKKQMKKFLITLGAQVDC